MTNSSKIKALLDKQAKATAKEIAEPAAPQEVPPQPEPVAPQVEAPPQPVDPPEEEEEQEDPELDEDLSDDEADAEAEAILAKSSYIPQDEVQVPVPQVEIVLPDPHGVVRDFNANINGVSLSFKRNEILSDGVQIKALLDKGHAGDIVPLTGSFEWIDCPNCKTKFPHSSFSSMRDA